MKPRTEISTNRNTRSNLANDLCLRALREPDVLSPAEIASLLAELQLRERAMVMLAGSTGLRRSELVALTWSDMDLELMQVNVRRSCVRNHFGDTKSEASRKPVPLYPSVVKCLKVWREDSPYRGNDDFIFPSIRRNGKQPLSPDTLLKKIIRPAVERAGIKGKAIGWHSFRHSLATNLRAAGVDLKNGAGAFAPCELTDHSRYLHASDLSEQA